MNELSTENKHIYYELDLLQNEIRFGSFYFSMLLVVFWSNILLQLCQQDFFEQFFTY